MMSSGAGAATPDSTVRNFAFAETKYATGHSNSNGPAPVHSSGTMKSNGHQDGHSNGNAHAAVLTSWKDIARYMGKGVRTVQRWEQDFGLPVRRPQGSNKKAILARPSDLDTWVAMRCTSRGVMVNKKNRPNDHGVSETMKRLSALAGALESSRILCENNQVLMREIGEGLRNLRASVVSIKMKQK